MAALSLSRPALDGRELINADYFKK